MAGYVVTEDQFSAELLFRLLSGRIGPGVRFGAGGRGSSALFLAHTILADGDPVVLVFEMDTAAETGMGDPYSTEDLLSGVAPSLHLYADPALDVVFFHDKQALARVLGVEITPEEGLLAQFRPRQALDTLLARSPTVRDREQLLAALDERAVARFAEHPLVARIQEFILSATARLARGSQEPAERLRKTG